MFEKEAEEWWNSWVVKDWNDIKEGKRLFIQAYIAGATETTKELRDELNYAKTHCLFHSDCPTQETNKERLTKANEIIEGLMRFCRCFAQHHTDDIRYKEAEKFLTGV